MTEIRPFKYDGQDVRTLTDPEGLTWFVATDVARILGYREAKDMTRRLDVDEKGRRSVPTPGGVQSLIVVNEAGLYASILGSRVVGAQRFKRWVTHEVLPSIQRTGSYTLPAQAPQVPQTYAEALRAAAAEVEAREQAEAYARQLEPKAAGYDTFLSADGTYSVGNVGKMFGLSQNKLFTLLRNAGVLIAKGHMRNTPYQRYMHHFEVRGGTFNRSDGTTSSSYTTRVQPSGVDFIGRKLGLQRTLDIDVDSAGEVAA